MKRLRTLILIILCFLSWGLNAQLNLNDYFLISNQQIDKKEARRLAIKITSDSTYEFVDNINRNYKIDKKVKKMEFPLGNELSKYSFIDGNIVIKTNTDTYIGSPIDSAIIKEKEYFRYLLVDLDLPVANDTDSIISSLDGITTMINSQTLYLSHHQKSLYPRYDKIGSCIIQFDNLKTTVCDIDNRCTMSGLSNRNKDLLFKNIMKDYQLKEDFIYTLYIDKDVKIKDINTTIRAIRKIENLSKIYFAFQALDNQEYIVSYITIPIDINLNDEFVSFKDWANASVDDRFISGERIMIIEDDIEIEDEGFGIVE